MKYEPGDKVTSSIYDSMFRRIINFSGVIERHWFGDLWSIIPNPNIYLNGGRIISHKNRIKILKE